MEQTAQTMPAQKPQLLRIFKLLFRLRCTTKTNNLIHAIRQIPLIKYLLPGDLYAAEGFKVMAYILVLLWELIATFLFKLIGMGAGVMLPILFFRSAVPDRVDNSALYLHMVLCYTIFGGIVHPNLTSGDQNAEIAIRLLRMDAGDYTLATYFYYLLRLSVGYLPFTLIFGLLMHLPLWLCLLLPLTFICTKLVFGRIELACNDRFTFTFAEKKANVITLTALILMIAAAYGPAIFGFVVPLPVSAGILLAMIPLGILCLKPVMTYPKYKDIIVRLIDFRLDTMDDLQNMQVKAVQKRIDTKTHVSSSRRGFEYLNELFIKRHRSLLWSATIKITIGAAVVAALCVMLCIKSPDIRPDINSWIMRGLPVFPFVFYGINRGTSFTQALFMNCDHCLLTYPFYKKPRAILALFRIRLREIMKINAVPAAVIGIGLVVLLVITGGTENPINYAVVICSPIALSMFFSVHYLTLYYLLQPYTAGSEMKSAFYKIISGLTYGVCYFMMRLQLPTLAFGICCILFYVIYSVIACLLVLKFAAKTFKLRT